jgi:hypothetical protein
MPYLLDSKTIFLTSAFTYKSVYIDKEICILTARNLFGDTLKVAVSGMSRMKVLPDIIIFQILEHYLMCILVY